MIVVEAKLISAVDGREETLCTMEIANVRTNEKGSQADYRVKLFSRGESPRLIRQAYVRDWPRNSKPAWRLIQKAFKVLG